MVPRVLDNNELRYRSVAALDGTEYVERSSTTRGVVLGDTVCAVRCLSGIIPCDAELIDF